MKAYLFSWNPDNWPFDERFDHIEEIRITGSTKQRWSVAAYKQVQPGDRAFIVKVGKTFGRQGVFGSGKIVSWPFLSPHWQDKKRMVERVIIEFDTLIDPETQKILPVDIIKKEILRHQVWMPEHSGIKINSDALKELEKLWADFIGTSLQGTGKPSTLPVYYEGNPYQINLTRYERDPKAREDCLSYHGYNCTVCEFNFKNVYGKNFIHIHHKEELSHSKKMKPIDPVKDLCPVCPNCHAMLHSQRPTMLVEELREIIEIQKRNAN
ncbi:5-methylcytosine-specific restriction enzyme A [Mucilaginibacter lappiensis]|uniref:5-methylcytosine-specific restriction protein A n=1 Tax=Mucilaginibacter lappiensis TaxID=354630 RepID=A0ABR6PNE1_9SPHI|nr:HNH endonuclease [Mucilaginibacter lappiensis]MBB6111278.1 5-methylcytosine-specific restriction protein A [Mucilaginibacter lappiensis]SIR74494.1 5-methylcytosine-specific restriction enzyme A [Mucilaginibacter lappiensis]